jgi:chromosome segregation ATPase
VIEMSASFLDRLEAEERSGADKLSADWQSVVAAIAADTEPRADRIRDVLLAAGRSVADLKASVELRRRRLELRRAYEELPGLKAREERIADDRDQAEVTLNEAIKKAQLEIVQARERYMQTTSALDAETAEVRNAKLPAEAARKELVQCCDDARAVAALAECKAKIGSAVKRAAEARESAKNLEDDVAQRRRPYCIDRDRQLAGEARTRAAQFERQAEDLRATLPQLEEDCTIV